MAMYLVVIFLIIVSLYFLPPGFDSIFYSPSANRTYKCLYVPKWFFSIVMSPPVLNARDTRHGTPLLRMVDAFVLPWKTPLPLPVPSVFHLGAVFMPVGHRP